MDTQPHGHITKWVYSSRAFGRREKRPGTVGRVARARGHLLPFPASSSSSICSLCQESSSSPAREAPLRQEECDSALPREPSGAPPQCRLRRVEIECMWKGAASRWRWFHGCAWAVQAGQQSPADRAQHGERAEGVEGGALLCTLQRDDHQCPGSASPLAEARADLGAGGASSSAWRGDWSCFDDRTVEGPDPRSRTCWPGMKSDCAHRGGWVRTRSHGCESNVPF